MTVTFAHPDGRIDIVSMNGFLEAVAAPQMLATLTVLDPDPTDVLTVADLALAHKRTEQAVVLYQWALDKLERDPSTIAKDTNLSGGYYFYGKALLELQRPAEAARALAMCTQLSPDDATGWYVWGMAASQGGDLDGALSHFRRALQLDGTDQNQDREFFNAVRATIEFTRHELVRCELEKAPEEFRRGFGLMAQEDYAAAARQMSEVAVASSEWSDPARCCLAHCLRHLDRHAEALAQLHKVSPATLRSLWRWYFHHTLPAVLNMVDDLPAALMACDATLEYFRHTNADEDVAGALSLKANVLKQQAFPLSKRPDMFDEGRPIIRAAIHCLARSMTLMPPEGNELDAELDGMTRIAARMKIDDSSLNLSDVSATVQAQVRARLLANTAAVTPPEAARAAPAVFDSPDYLSDAERQLRQDPFAKAVGVMMPADSFATLRSSGRAELVRDTLIAALRVPSYSRKVAAFALGQLGDPSAIPALERQRATEPSRGDVEAQSAAIATLREMPVDSGSTDAARAKAVENAYHGRALRSQEPSPTRHLRDGSLNTRKSTNDEMNAPKQQQGFFKRLFGG